MLGYYRVAVFPADVQTDKVVFRANVTIQEFIPDPEAGLEIETTKNGTVCIKAERHIMSSTIKGSLKHFIDSGKTILDIGNGRDFRYPNSYFGSGVRSYISSELIESMAARIPNTGDKKKDVAVAMFRVLDGKAQKIEVTSQRSAEYSKHANEIINGAEKAADEPTPEGSQEIAEGVHTEEDHDNHAEQSANE